MLHTLVFAAILNGTVVTHHKSGAHEPVAAALVELRLTYAAPVVAAAMTALDGTFTIPDVAPGQYFVSVTANQGGTGGLVTVTRNPVDPQRTFYFFDPTCDAKFGRVLDSITGEPIAGARVEYIGATTTDANGDYFIDFGCFSGPGFRFHNSFFYGAEAEGYRTLSIFGGRAEDSAYGGVLDFELKPLLRPLRPLVRRPE